MATLQTLLVLTLMCFLESAGAKTCESPKCPMIRSPSITLNPTIQFPFRLKSQPDRCGYPGFDLSCNDSNQTIIYIPSRGGELAVTSIDYRHQRFQVNDPDNCMPGRYLVDFSVDFPFKVDSLYDRYFTYLNCTGNIGEYGSLTRFDCLGGPNYTVAAMLTGEYGGRRVELPCREIRTVLVPYFGFGVGPEGDVSIKWAEPDCGACALQSGSCGFKGRSGLEVKCSLPRVSGKDSGLYVGAKFGIAIGAGLFGITFLSGLAFFFSGRRGRHQPPSAAAASVAPRPVVATGLSRPAIELYPKLTLGPEFDSSGTLPNIACPICLCQYKSGEEVRMIPDCEDYFHLNCIDLWLERNATCSLCRKPQ